MRSRERRSRGRRCRRQQLPTASGCSSSIAAALGALDPRCEVMVLMLGDQPGVSASHGRGPSCRPRRRAAGRVPLRGRPRASDRLRAQRLCTSSRSARDKGVWRLLDRAPSDVAEVDDPGTGSRSTSTRPRTTEAVLARGAGSGVSVARGDPEQINQMGAPDAGHGRSRRGDRPARTRCRDARAAAGAVDYLVDEGLATSMFLSVAAAAAAVAGGRGGGRQDRGGEVAGAGAGYASDPAAVL